MSRLQAVAITGFIAIAPFGAVRAADVPLGLPPLVQNAPVFVEEYRSGWYLRGDLGYRMNDLGGVDSAYRNHPVRRIRSTTASPSAAAPVTSPAGSAWMRRWIRRRERAIRQSPPITA